MIDPASLNVLVLCAVVGLVLLVVWLMPNNMHEAMIRLDRWVARRSRKTKNK